MKDFEPVQHHSDEGHLGAGEMHAAALGERVAEVARRTTDPVLGQVGLLIVVITFRMKVTSKMMRKPDLNSFSLGVRVVLLLPTGKVRARDSLVLIKSRFQGWLS